MSVLRRVGGALGRHPVTVIAVVAVLGVLGVTSIVVVRDMPRTTAVAKRDAHDHVAEDGPVLDPALGAVSTSTVPTVPPPSPGRALAPGEVVVDNKTTTTIVRGGPAATLPQEVTSAEEAKNGLPSGDAPQELSSTLPELVRSGEPVVFPNGVLRWVAFNPKEPMAANVAAMRAHFSQGPWRITSFPEVGAITTPSGPAPFQTIYAQSSTHKVVIGVIEATGGAGSSVQIDVGPV